MTRILGITLFVGFAGTVSAQPADLEIPGIFNWECVPTYAATRDELQLHAAPNLEAERLVIPYRTEWAVPAPHRNGVTRILKVGTLRVVEADDQMYCEVDPIEGSFELVPGEFVQYLHRHAEGRGAIRFRGARCVARTNEFFGLFELIEEPVTQEWLRVFYADGVSPGWLLNDGTQTRVSTCSG